MTRNQYLARLIATALLAFAAGFLITMKADAFGKRHTLSIRAGCPACVCDEDGKCSCSKDPCEQPRPTKKTLFKGPTH